MSSGSFDGVNLPIIGIAAEYPTFNHDSSVLDRVIKLHYPKSASDTDHRRLDKVRMINKYTGIENRSSVLAEDHPLMTRKIPPNISEISAEFSSKGIPLAVAAARKALQEAQTSVSEITHIVSTTCTNSANPGFDHLVIKELGLTQPVEKVLLHGVGCSGGLASLRTAANLALGHTARGLPARVLVIALEICSLLIRSELDSIFEKDEVRIGVTLFSDCGSSLVLSNGLGHHTTEPVYELLGWDHRLIPETEQDLRFDVVLSPQVPKLTCGSLRPSFDALIGSLPNLPPSYKKPADFDWALHPGGALILSGVEKEMKLTPEHMRASYDIYINHGNSSSTSVLAVLSRLRDKDMDGYSPGKKAKDYVVSAAFGPGITVETCMLKRNLNRAARTSQTSGDMTPPETESEGSRSEIDDSDSEYNISTEVADCKLYSESSIMKEDNNESRQLTRPDKLATEQDTYSQMPIASSAHNSVSDNLNVLIDSLDIVDLD
ncbi:2-pyrone synthase [Golovinomyces cichoracearum]|uniref:2-pyrone synthase n=1 Tax=Golovinomyces cichoracearum TaxID=62708 RepID=A0A420I9P9_9PEZI|nr:2-pyrone synthase [Golovinomyces cichoracearum]